MMKRGCKVHVLAGPGKDLGLKKLGGWDPSLSLIDGEPDLESGRRLAKEKKALALITETRLVDPIPLPSGNDLPTVHPLIGLNDERIHQMMERI